MKETLKVLQECSDLQLKKANDYQNPNSHIKQADYYPRGVASLPKLLDGFLHLVYACSQMRIC